jgi:hypothetical protein
LGFAEQTAESIGPNSVQWIGYREKNAARRPEGLEFEQRERNKWRIWVLDLVEKGVDAVDNNVVVKIGFPWAKSGE